MKPSISGESVAVMQEVGIARIPWVRIASPDLGWAVILPGWFGRKRPKHTKLIIN